MQRHRHVAEAGVLVAAGPFDRARTLDLVDPVEEPVEHEADLDAGEVGAEAEVPAVTEGQVRIW